MLQDCPVNTLAMQTLAEIMVEFFFFFFYIRLLRATFSAILLSKRGGCVLPFIKVVGRLFRLAGGGGDFRHVAGRSFFVDRKCWNSADREGVWCESVLIRQGPAKFPTCVIAPPRHNLRDLCLTVTPSLYEVMFPLPSLPHCLCISSVSLGAVLLSVISTLSLGYVTLDLLF